MEICIHVENVLEGNKGGTKAQQGTLKGIHLQVLWDSQVLWG